MTDVLPSGPTVAVGVIPEHIVKTPGMMSGYARVVNSRIRVMDIVGWRRQGRTAEDIAHDFPWISLADVYAALAYAEDHADEIAENYAESDRIADQFLRDHPETLVICVDDLPEE